MRLNFRPKKYNSTWGMGKSSLSSYDEYTDNTRIPTGKISSVNGVPDASLLYDEYIVYHEEQINLRYIIMLKIK